MFGKTFLALSVLAWASAQIPNLGFCPEYVPMANFNMERFTGIWYESERYFQLTEVVSRCVMTNYTKGDDGKYRVSNQVTNRFTGIKRILEGEIKPAASKAEEGKLQIKYTTIPLTPEIKYSVLETDYDSYAVLWSCQGIGPLHAQNAWVMTRQPIPSGEVLQKAYGVLDKYKISKTFFVKTDQADCAHEKPAQQPTAEGSDRSKSNEMNPSAENAKASIIPTPDILSEKPLAAETVPERILKIAEEIKEEEESDGKKLIILEVEEAVENANERTSTKERTD